MTIFRLLKRFFKVKCSIARIGAGRTATITISGTGIETDATVNSSSASGGTATVNTTGVSVGVATLTVKNPGGKTGSVKIEVTPALTGLSVASTPPDIAVGATRSIVIQGTGIHPGATVTDLGEGLSIVGSPTFNGETLTASIAVSPQAPLGPQSFTVENPDGATATVSNLVIRPQPTAIALSPSWINAGTSGTPLSPSGTDFALGAIIKAAPEPGTLGNVYTTAAQLIGSERLTVVVAASDNAGGPWKLTIVNRNGGRTEIPITIGPKLNLQSVRLTSSAAEAPVTEAQQGQTVSLTVTGEGFSSSMSFRLSGAGMRVQSVRRADSNTYTFNLVISSTAVTGPRSLTAVSPHGLTSTLVNAFTITPGPEPSG